MRIGIGLNEWAQNLPREFEKTCQSLDIDYQIIDFINFSDVDVTHLTPALLYLKPEAVQRYKELESQGVKTLNPVDAIAVADDKAATYEKLKASDIPQLPTEIIELNLDQMQKSFISNGTVYKRTHGGQGRWVRLARNPDEIAAIYDEFITEGPGRVVVQPFIHESNAETIRVIVTGEKVLAAALRQGENNFRSNIAQGGSQRAVDLSPELTQLSIAATRALGLRHSGLDLIFTNEGFKVLEVNACPDFTSMQPQAHINIAEEVIKTLLLT